jgi:hypothetical protein
MKKSLLTLSIIGAAVAAFGQGSIFLETGTTVGVQGFNSVSSDVNDSGAAGSYSDYVSGTVTLELFFATGAGDASLANQATSINALDAAGSGGAAATLLASDFTQVAFGLNAGSEAMQQAFAVSFGGINVPNTYAVGNSAALTSGSVGLYGLIGSWVSGGQTYTGALVLNGKGAQEMGGGAFPDFNAGGTWPVQNMLLTTGTTPEPATLALAGLGGLSMLFLRRRKQS